MPTRNEYHPKVVFHPGHDLREKLKELGIEPSEFAERIGVPGQTILFIINGKEAVTSELAEQFEKSLSIPAHFWLARQRSFYRTRA